MAGCGGDANPASRGEVALAEEHGDSLAAAVGQVLDGDLHALDGQLNVRFDRLDLAFVDPPTKLELVRKQNATTVATANFHKFKF